jgi:tetratricopeptide (TPR) repeat protein
MLTKFKWLLPLGKSQPADDSKACKKEGDEHLKGGRPDAAAESYRRAVSIAPDYLDACIGLGFVLSEQQQYDEAQRYLRHALSLDSGTPTFIMCWVPSRTIKATALAP